MPLTLVPSPNETTDKDENKLRVDWESSAQCTQLILLWSLRRQAEARERSANPLIEVLKNELNRRRGLRAYGVKLKARVRKFIPQLLTDSSR